MRKLECPGCGRLFLWTPNRKFHSTECRRKHDREARLSAGNELWETTSEVEYTAEQQLQSFSVRLAEVLAKSGAAFYRLGCPKNSNRSPPFIVRWFPSRGTVRTYLSANELPRDIPLPGLYLVALFTKEKELVNKPAFKLTVEGFDPTLHWSSGTFQP